MECLRVKRGSTRQRHSPLFLKRRRMFFFLLRFRRHRVHRYGRYLAFPPAKCTSGPHRRLSGILIIVEGSTIYRRYVNMVYVLRIYRPSLLHMLYSSLNKRRHARTSITDIWEMCWFWVAGLCVLHYFHIKDHTRHWWWSKNETVWTRDAVK